MSEIESLIEAAKQGNLEEAKGILEADPDVANERDESGAAALHYAAQNGHRPLVKLLIESGADINCVDDLYGSTPAGWAIEYLREMGGYLATELDDLSYAIQMGDARWVERFLGRHPLLRQSCNKKGTPFQRLARGSGSQEIAALFETPA